MTQNAEKPDNTEQTPGKTPATGFSGHDDVYGYLEDQKRLEETAQQHQETADMMDRLAEEEETRRKDAQKQSAPANNDEEAGQETDEPEAQAPAGSSPPHNPLEETLCKLYGASYLSELYVHKLNDFSLVRVMPDKDDQDKLAMVAIKHDERVFELTETHVITESGIDPQAAYDLALHAKLNPKLAEEGVSMLPGSDADRVLLYFAAQAFGLKVNNADELTEEQKANPPEEWTAFLASLTDHPPPESEAEKEEPSQEQPESEHNNTGYEAGEPEAEAEPTANAEAEQGPEPEMVQGISMGPQPVETSRYGHDYFNATYPEPESVTFYTGTHDPEEAAKIPTLTDVVEENPDEPAPETEDPDTQKNDAGEQQDPAKEADTEITSFSVPPANAEFQHLEDDAAPLPADSDENTVEVSSDATQEEATDTPQHETEEDAPLNAREAIKAPVSEDTMTALFNANVAKKTYMEARKQVINEGKASRSFLRDAFNLTDRQAKAVQACLREDNIIAKEGSNRHVVLVKPS